MPTLYGLKACDTCRKVAKALEKAGKEVTFRDVRADPLPRATWEMFHRVFGDALLNTRSTTWRGLTDQERRLPVLQLLADHPALMKRPVIEDGDGLTLGWNDEVQGRHLG